MWTFIRDFHWLSNLGKSRLSKQNFRTANYWIATYETSNYGKPKTKEEFYNRLDMLSKNLVKINKSVKELAIKKKVMKLNEDF